MEGNGTTAEMANQSTTSPFSYSSTIMISSTMSAPTSTRSVSADTKNIILNASYVYSFFASLGFIAGCFLLYSFIQTYRAHRRLAWLDCLLWVFCGFQLLLLLLSLHAVAYSSDYLMTTALGCAALSFFINTASLCSLLVLVLMAYVLTLDPPSHAMLRKPGVCAALVILSSVLLSLVLAGLRGSSSSLEEKIKCFMDQAHAGVSYAAAKLCLAFLVPYILQLGLLIGGCVRQWKSKGRFLSGSEEGPMFLTITVVVFSCLLFYNVVLVKVAKLQTYEQPLLHVAEFVLFSGSSATLLLVLVMHRPCRESLYGVFKQLRDCCRSRGHTQPNRNIIAPHIEVTDTLQDIES